MNLGLREQYYKKLTIRNIFLNLAVFVSPFLVLFIIANYETTQIIKKRIYYQLEDTVTENSKTINYCLEDRELDLKSYSQFNVESIDEVTQLVPLLTSLLQEKKWYDLVFIADLKGNIILTIGREVQGNISSRKYFQASAQGKAYNSGIFYSDLIKGPVMVLSQPLTNKHKKIIGVIAASLNLKNFYNLLFNLRLGETSELFMVDSEGKLLSPTRLGGKPLDDYGFLRGKGNPHFGEKGIKTHIDYRGQQVLCAYKKLPAADFYLVSEIDLREALLPAKEMSRMVLYVFIPFFVLLVFLSNLYSIRITSILRKLTGDLEKALEESEKKKKEVDVINLELEKKIQETELLAGELKLSDEYIRNIINSISLGLISLDHSSIITHHNKEIRIMFHFDESINGKNVFSVLPWLNDQSIKTAYENAASSGKATRILHQQIDRGKGEEYFNLSFFPIEEIPGTIDGVTLLIEDVTEREILQEQLAKYEKLSSLSQLALGAAHEINNPLLGISSYLEIQIEDSKDEKEKEEIKIVLENVYRISNTIRGLLNFARPTPPQFTKVDVNQLIEDTLSFISLQPLFRKVKIEKNLLSSLPQITADLNQLRQVLTNVFINAAQAMLQGGILRVETSKVKFEEFIQIDIADSGIGISADNLKKIFDPFFTTKKSQGTGLGLSISLSYIKNHDGDIIVKSEINKGTTFTLLLPIRQSGKIVFMDEEVIS